MTYELIDSGNQKKIERFGPISLIRPSGAALWRPQRSHWEATAEFSREREGGWEGKLPRSWTIEYGGLTFKLCPTDFGHLGIFPEHRMIWEWAAKSIEKDDQVLNLFAYSGGATLALAKAGAAVCHLDASKGMVDWARENAKLNGLDDCPIRWIVDDALKFLKREVKRGRRYEGILLDPPSFGRGAKGEVFKIERDIQELLSLCRSLLSDRPKFLVVSCHTNQMSPTVMQNLLSDEVEGEIEAGELLLPSDSGRPLPTGTFARWRP